MSVNDLLRNKEKYDKFYNYWKSIAENSLFLNHSETEMHFVRHDIQRIGAVKVAKLKSPYMGLEDPRVSYKNNTHANIQLVWHSAIVIAREVREGDEAAIQAARTEAMVIIESILSKLRYDRSHNKLLYFDFEGVQIVPVNEHFRNCYGYRMSFQFPSQFDMNFDPEEWQNETGTAEPMPFATVNDQGEIVKLDPYGSYTCAAPLPPADGVVELFDAADNPLGTIVVPSGDNVPHVLPNAPYTLRDSVGTAIKSGSILSVTGGDIAVADTTYTDSDGQPVTQPAAVPVVCTLAEIASVAVSVSSMTPLAGSTLTITATPKGITPTSYTFYAYDGSTVTFIGQQAGNVYNWNVSKFGNYEIHVLATDGTINAYGKVSVVGTSTFLLDQIASRPELAFALRRLYAKYVGYATTVRRLVDNATLPIGFVGEHFDAATFIDFVGVGNVFSAILYNQSMSFNAAQPTAANQPTMAIGGTISMLNGKPTIVFDTVGDIMNVTPIGSSHVFAVARAITINASQAQYICGYAANGMGIAGTGVSGIFMFNSPTLIATTIKDTVAHQLSFRCGLSNTARIRVDGTTGPTGTMLPMVVSAIGGNPGAGFASNLELSEFISFSTNIPNAEELVIEANQKAYYGTP